MSEKDDQFTPVPTKTQDPKYVIIDGALCNSATLEPIPRDEPIFIMRGKDKHAAEAIRSYAESCSNDQHREVVGKREQDFINFANDHEDVMHEPDTDTPVTSEVGSEGEDSAAEDADTEMTGDGTDEEPGPGDK